MSIDTSILCEAIGFGVAVVLISLLFSAIVLSLVRSVVKDVMHEIRRIKRLHRVKKNKCIQS